MPVGHQRLEIDFFGRHMELVVFIVAAAARGQSDPLPSGGPIAGALEAAPFHKGLHQIDRMPVFLLPVGR